MRSSKPLYEEEIVQALDMATQPAETRMITIPIALSGWIGVCKNTNWYIDA